MAERFWWFGFRLKWFSISIADFAVRPCGLYKHNILINSGYLLVENYSIKYNFHYVKIDEPQISSTVKMQIFTYTRFESSNY